MALTRTQHAAVLLLITSSLWGVVWIPLRLLDDMEFHPAAAMVLIAAMALLILIPMALAKGAHRQIKIPKLWLIGLVNGCAIACYFSSLVYTDVLRAIFLFYLMPIWTTLFAWVFLKEAITQRKVIAFIFAALGLWLLLGGFSGSPTPQNAGDWMAILAGITWGGGIVLVRSSPEIDYRGSTCVSVLFAVLISGVILTIDHHASWPLLSSDLWLQALLYTALIGIFIIAFATTVGIWAAGILAPTTTALLTMSEVVAGTLSASLLSQTTLPLAGKIGGCLIIVAVLIDLLASSPDKTQQLQSNPS